jgi:hypothetical protein
VPRPRDPFANPVRVYQRTYRSGTQVWIVLYYPTGVITRREDRKLLGSFTTKAAAEEAAEKIRAALTDAVTASRNDLPRSSLLLRVVTTAYRDEIQSDGAVPKGTAKAAESPSQCGNRW